MRAFTVWTQFRSLTCKEIDSDFHYIITGLSLMAVFYNNSITMIGHPTRTITRRNS